MRDVIDYLTGLLFLITLSNGQKENVLYDFAKVAEPNVTKIAYFYNVDQTNKSVPINQTNLNLVSSYLTMNTVLNNSDQVFVKYYKTPNFQQLNKSKYFNESWIGTRNMNQQELTTWMQYSQNILKSPTFTWILVTRFCFQNTNDVDLYDYTAIIPAVSRTTYMYVFTWKDKDMNDCAQATFSLNYDQIVCVAMKGVNCFPPFR